VMRNSLAPEQENHEYFLHCVNRAHSISSFIHGIPNPVSHFTHTIPVLSQQKAYASLIRLFIL
jgi:hypothetical protein